jgi:hypothetical protein
MRETSCIKRVVASPTHPLHHKIFVSSDTKIRTDASKSRNHPRHRQKQVKSFKSHHKIQALLTTPLGKLLSIPNHPMESFCTQARRKRSSLLPLLPPSIGSEPVLQGPGKQTWSGLSVPNNHLSVSRVISWVLGFLASWVKHKGSYAEHALHILVSSDSFLQVHFIGLANIEIQFIEAVDKPNCAEISGIKYISMRSITSRFG